MGVSDELRTLLRSGVFIGLDCSYVGGTMHEGNGPNMARDVERGASDGRYVKRGGNDERDAECGGKRWKNIKSLHVGCS